MRHQPITGRIYICLIGKYKNPNAIYKKEGKMETISLRNVAKESKLLLLNELGFASDGIFIYDADGNKVYDKYIKEAVKVDNMLILPGSALILDDNALSVAAYLEEYGDRL